MGSAEETIQRSIPKNKELWPVFKGDDYNYPVEMFIHIMEYRYSHYQTNQSGKQYASPGIRDNITRFVLSHIPDPNLPANDLSSMLDSPSTVWMQQIGKEGLDLHDWQAVRESLLQEFGLGLKTYTLKEKLALLNF